MIALNTSRVEHTPPSLTAPLSGQVVSNTTPYLSKESPLDFLRRFEGQSRVYWTNGVETLAGAGAAAVILAHGADRIASVREQIQALLARAHIQTVGETIGPRLLGGFSFTPSARAEGLWSAFPAALFILPRFLLTRRCPSECWLTITEIRDIEESHEVDGALPCRVERAPRLNTIQDIRYLTSSEAWTAALNNAIGHIRAGTLEKVVLARCCEVTAAEPLDALAALTGLNQRYPNTVRFLIEPQPGQCFFGATPEKLVDVREGMLETIALAGSTPRGGTPEEDASLGTALLSNPKERSEHEIVVRFLRSALVDLASDIHIPDEPSLQRLHNIQHLRTEVRAALAAGYDVLDAIEALHPTPALGGLPREKALRLIEALEPEPRGWYGAPIGWLDVKGNGSFAVAIRSAVSSGDRARLYAGAGIVADSQPEREWQETALKLRPMLEALSGGGKA